MSEKAVSIGNYVVATGIDTFLGVHPMVKASNVVDGLLQGGIRDWVGAVSYTHLMLCLPFCHFLFFENLMQYLITGPR